MLQLKIECLHGAVLKKKTDSHLFAFFLFLCGTVLIPAVLLTRWVSIFFNCRMKERGQVTQVRTVHIEEKELRQYAHAHCTIENFIDNLKLNFCLIFSFPIHSPGTEKLKVYGVRRLSIV